jgi:hypothetical protein
LLIVEAQDGSMAFDTWHASGLVRGRVGRLDRGMTRSLVRNAPILRSDPAKSPYPDLGRRGYNGPLRPQSRPARGAGT